MKKGLTVVFFILIYFFAVTNVFALEETEIEKIDNLDYEVEKVEKSSKEEIEKENEVNGIETEENIIENVETEQTSKDYLVDLEPVEEIGENLNVSKEIEDEVYDKSIEGEDFELIYNAEEYNALNFLIENNNENDNTVYAVMLDEEKIYEEYIDNKELKEVKLNINGKLLKICLKGNGSFINPYLTKEKNKYIIIYDDEDTYETEESTYTIKGENEKEGYVFKYYENIDGKKYYPDDEIYLNNDMTLTSKYEEEEYEVTYNYLDSEEKRRYTINDNSLFIPEIEGYKFLGWFDIEENKVDKLTTGNITLYAKFEKITIINSESTPKKLNYNYSHDDIKQVEISKEENIIENIKDKTVSIEQIDTPFNSRTVNVNYILILGVLIILIAVFTIFKFNLNS